jgi:hypothetical protein
LTSSHLQGFPEIVSYLTKQPNFYCSHAFCYIHLFNVHNFAVATVDAFCEQLRGQSSLSLPKDATHELPYMPRKASSSFGKALCDMDYKWRPDCVTAMPFYFFAAAMDSDTTADVLPWHMYLDETGVWHTHPCASFLRSKHVEAGKGDGQKALLLRPDDDEDRPLVEATHYCKVILNAPWRVPVVYGPRPQAPHDISRSKHNS